MQGKPENLPRQSQPAMLVRGLRMGLIAVSQVAAAVQAQARPTGHKSEAVSSARVTESEETRAMAGWVVASGDNGGLPFVIIDKVHAEVSIFTAQGLLRGASAALLGMARGDESAPDIGNRKLSAIRPEERTTPAGRFVASLGHDLGEADVLWIDYAAALSMHRVVKGNANDHRLKRLASPSTLDNRISYGCINVPAKFFDQYVQTGFGGTQGIVYILPETKSAAQVFGL